MLTTRSCCRCCSLHRHRLRTNPEWTRSSISLQDGQGTQFPKSSLWEADIAVRGRRLRCVCLRVYMCACVQAWTVSPAGPVALYLTARLGSRSPQRSLDANTVEESKGAEVAGSINYDAVHSIRVSTEKTNSNVLLRT